MNSSIGPTESETLIKLVKNPISNIYKKNHFIQNDKTNKFTKCCTHSVHPPLSAGGGGKPPTKFSKRGGLTGPTLLEGGCWERGGDFFQGGCNFHIKNKLKSEIFNDKKSL